MNEWATGHRFKILLLAIAASIFLAGCERPDPDPVSAAPEIIIPTVPAPAVPTATPVPIQVNVSVIMPTTEAAVQVVPEIVQVIVVSPTPEPTEETALVPTEIPPTPYPTNYYMGWLWAESLTSNPDGRFYLDLNGAKLWDRPSPDGKRIGLVIGLTEVIVVGQSYCGYAPVLVHQDNMLSRIIPRPEVYQPLPTSDQQDAAPQFAVSEGTTSGWVYLGAVDVMDRSAVAGEFGLNLRQEPCLYAENIGFIPAGGEMEITAPPSGDYIPVRVNNDVIQLPGRLEAQIQFEPVTDLSSITLPPTPTPYFP